MAVLDLEPQDVQGLLRWDRPLVRPVGGREGVVDVADSHHLGLERDVVGAQAVGIAGAVQLLVMRIGDGGDAAKVLGPGDLAQEAEAVGDVGLDLQPLLKVKAALGDGEVLGLLGEKIGLEAPVHVRICVGRDLQDPLEAPLGEDGGLVRLQDEGKLIVHLG